MAISALQIKNVILLSKIAKIQDGGRRHFEFSQKAVNHEPFDRFQSNLMHKCKTLSLACTYKNRKCKLKSKMAAVAILEIDKVQ